jgi:hypothetical protein
MSNETERRGSSRSSTQSPQHVSPYEFTKTGVIGDQRDTMLHSELQILVCLSFLIFLIIKKNPDFLLVGIR